jgi:undecaprenyl-diphosphatase
MNSVHTIDSRLFLLVNHLPHTAFSNALALFLSGIGSYGFIWFVIAIALFLREEKKDHRFFLPIITTLLATWVLVEYILKNIVARIRPTDAIDAWVFVTNLTDYSFPSSHSAIAWAMAAVLSRYEPRIRWVFYTLASLIALSRVYLGVHFPLDIVGGAFFGYCIGCGIVYGFTGQTSKKGMRR